MAMFRAMSVRRNPMRYERLGEEPTVILLDAKLERAKSVPAFVFGSSKSTTHKLGEVVLPGNAPAKPAATSKKAAKSHPLFSLFDGRRRMKKPTANPDLARYLEYLKEGGLWDVESNKPVMHYK